LFVIALDLLADWVVLNWTLDAKTDGRLGLKKDFWALH